MDLKRRLTIIFIVLMSIPIILAIAGFVLVLLSGSAFVPTPLFMEVFLTLILVLVLVGVGITTWINKSVFSRIRVLNEAMKSIADGNFDDALSTEEVGGEIEQLFHSYEDMRLKLKENTADTMHNEQHNKELIKKVLSFSAFQWRGSSTLRLRVTILK